MQPYEQNPYAYGTGFARTAAQVDQGLRTFMLGVYNNMVAGPGHFGPGRARHQHGGDDARPPTPRRGSAASTSPSSAALLYGTPLMWVVALAPLAFIFFFSFRMDRMSAASARTTFFAFAAVMGASLSTLLIRYTGASVVQVFFITAAAFGALSPLGLHHEAQPVGHGLVPDDGPDRPDHRLARQHLPGFERAAVRDLGASAC